MNWMILSLFGFLAFLTPIIKILKSCSKSGEDFEKYLINLDFDEMRVIQFQVTVGISMILLGASLQIVMH